MDLVDALLAFALVFALLWLGGGLWGFWMARSRGGSQSQWAAFALFLGPFGLLLAHKLSHPCPGCASLILRGLRSCPFCHRPIPRQSEGQNPKGSFWSDRRNW